MSKVETPGRVSSGKAGPDETKGREEKMKDFRAMIQIKATGQKKIVKLGENIQTEEDAKKALDIRFGDNAEVIMIVDVNEEV